MQDHGLVSIITPTYNCARFIAKTIESVKAQTYTNFEMIIVDDYSADNTADVVAPYIKADSRIIYHRLECNSGAAVARNTALRMARGSWIAFLDSDDIWLPQKLEHQLNFMMKNGYAFTYHPYTEIDEEGKPLGVYVGGKRRVSMFDMFACCWPGCLSVIYNADKIGLIQIADIKKNNDTALWLKVVKKADCYLLNENLAKYRRRRGSITPPDIKTRIRWHYTLFRKAENKRLPLAVFWTCMNIVANSIKKIFYVKHYSV